MQRINRGALREGCRLGRVDKLVLVPSLPGAVFPWPREVVQVVPVSVSPSFSVDCALSRFITSHGILQNMLGFFYYY